MLVLLQMFIYNPVYKTGNGHLRSSNCKKTLDMRVIFLVDIDLYPISNRIVYQIDGFIESAFRRPGSRYVFQYLKRNPGCIVIPVVSFVMSAVSPETSRTSFPLFLPLNSLRKINNDNL